MLGLGWQQTNAASLMIKLFTMDFKGLICLILVNCFMFLKFVVTGERVV